MYLYKCKIIMNWSHQTNLVPASPRTLPRLRALAPGSGDEILWCSRTWYLKPDPQISHISPKGHLRKVHQKNIRNDLQICIDAAFHQIIHSQDQLFEPPDRSDATAMQQKWKVWPNPNHGFSIGIFRLQPHVASYFKLPCLNTSCKSCFQNVQPKSPHSDFFVHPKIKLLQLDSWTASPPVKLLPDFVQVCLDIHRSPGQDHQARPAMCHALQNGSKRCGFDPPTSSWTPSSPCEVASSLWQWAWQTVLHGGIPSRRRTARGCKSWTSAPSQAICRKQRNPATPSQYDDNRSI